MKRGLIAALLLLTAGCGGNDDASATTTGDETALRKAVQGYSDAYLTGDAHTAYALMSSRCQGRIDPKAFAAIVGDAKAVYGSALPIKTFDADVQETQARVTYTYAMSAIDQTGQPWVNEGGWKYDAC